MTPDRLLMRLDVATLYPPFLARIQSMLAECIGLGAHYWAVSGFRGYEEQARLYAQGRTTAGRWVTMAQAGESAHNFGLAVDFVRDALPERSGLQPNWQPASYVVLGEVAPRHKLTWGGVWRFKDNPHVQWPGFVTGLDLQPLRKCMASGGIEAVWKFLDTLEAA